jgi:uncharacterized protein
MHSRAVASTADHQLITLAVGFGAGLLNAMIGVGGGIIIVPGLVLVRQVSPRLAVATSLGAVLVFSSVALGAHLAMTSLRLSSLGAVLLLAAGALGSQLGAVLLHRISVKWILYAFAAVAFVSALQMLATGLSLLPPLAPGGSEPSLASYALIGLSGGVLSGLVGIGGGSIAILCLSLLFQTPIAASLPIAQGANVVNSLSGVLAKKNRGQVRWREVALLAPSGLVGIAVGQALALYLPANALRVAFALFFLFMAASLVKRARAQAKV